MHGSSQIATKRIEEELFEHYQQVNAANVDASRIRTYITADIQEIRKLQFGSLAEQSKMSSSLNKVVDFLQDLDFYNTRTRTELLEQGQQIQNGFQQYNDSLKELRRHSVQQQQQQGQRGDRILICKAKFKIVVERYNLLLIGYVGKVLTSKKYSSFLIATEVRLDALTVCRIILIKYLLLTLYSRRCPRLLQFLHTLGCLSVGPFRAITGNPILFEDFLGDSHWLERSTFQYFRVCISPSQLFYVEVNVFLGV